MLLEQIWSTDLRQAALRCAERRRTAPRGPADPLFPQVGGVAGLRWGSRGRRFKSCRPDGSSGRHLITRCRPELRKRFILRSSSRSSSVLSGRLIDGNWSKSGALVFRPRNGVTVCSRLLYRLATVDARWAQLASDASTRSSPSDDRLPRSKGVSTGLGCQKPCTPHAAC